ncbi:MAG: hypothetical protein A2Z69_00400 [Bacteroidetes bacterium RBG_13_44_24]|nr:MAG: hypothetical protein A2Z69_00400 [Bacteroidetes bacterium RBG_13_44_24]
MSKKISGLMRSKKIINEIKLGLHLQMDKEMEMRMELFVGSNLLAVYYDGYTDGLQKAREIAFPELHKKGGEK